MSKQTLFYRVHFLAHNSEYQIYAKEVSSSSLFGFIEIGDLVFGKAGSVVVDPAEEKLRTEFSGVNRFYIPMHAVIRIDEVEKSGVAKIVDTKTSEGKITPFPIYTQAKGE